MCILINAWTTPWQARVIHALIPRAQRAATRTNAQYLSVSSVERGAFLASRSPSAVARPRRQKRRGSVQSCTTRTGLRVLQTERHLQKGTRSTDHTSEGFLSAALRDGRRCRAPEYRHTRPSHMGDGHLLHGLLFSPLFCLPEPPVFGLHAAASLHRYAGMRATSLMTLMAFRPCVLEAAMFNSRLLHLHGIPLHLCARLHLLDQDVCMRLLVPGACWRES